MLTIGVLALSSAAVLIRLADAPALTVAFYRVAFSAALMMLISGGTRRLARSDLQWRAAAFAGAALALHFWAWMRSLELTSVATSTLLVTTTPVWIAIAAPWLPDEPRLGATGWGGLAVALAGGALVSLAPALGGASSSAGHGSGPWGPLLALAGAWLMAAYLVIGRAARQRMPLNPYVTVTNMVAAVVLGAIVLATRAPTHRFSTPTWLALAGLALLPQLVGYGSLLWAVRTTGASVVALLVLLEPIGAALLAWWLLGEAPSRIEVVGGVLLLLGLVLVVRSRNPDVSRETHTR